MYIHFTFKDGSNPYIATTNKAFFDMISKYYITQINKNNFVVDGKLTIWTVHTNKSFSRRERGQVVLRDFAVQWMQDGGDICYSYGDLVEWQEFFYEYGKKFGLLREFRQNGIPC